MPSPEVRLRFGSSEEEGKRTSGAVQEQRLGAVAGRGLYLPAKVQGESVECLIDTGAEVTLAQDKFCPKEQRNKEVVLTGITGERIPTSGHGILELKAHGRTYETPAVFADVPEDVILGSDFLEEQKAVLNFPDQHVELGNYKHPVAFKPEERIGTIKIVTDLPVYLQDLFR